MVSFLLQKALGLNIKERGAWNKLEIGWVGSRGGCEGHERSWGRGKNILKTYCIKLNKNSKTKKKWAASKLEITSH